MTTSNNTVAQKNVTKVKLFVLFVLLVLSSNGVFGQSKVAVTTVAATTEVTVSKNDTIVITSQSTVASLDFAVWFMGANKTTNGNKTNGGFSKKALINSGINTNSVLIRSILKKVSSQESSVA